MHRHNRQERLNAREAIEGEELVVRDFPNKLRGLASPKAPEIPVFLPNGCKLRISDIPKNLQKELRVDSEAVAEFREVFQQSPCSLLARIFLSRKQCFNVVLFSSGRSLEIAKFAPAMKVDVLSPAIVAPVGDAIYVGF